MVCDMNSTTTKYRMTEYWISQSEKEYCVERQEWYETKWSPVVETTHKEIAEQELAKLQASAAAK